MEKARKRIAGKNKTKGGGEKGEERTENEEGTGEKAERGKK
jgi:hypothetical protein